jgi:hypothetical protein
MKEYTATRGGLGRDIERSHMATTKTRKSSTPKATEPVAVEKPAKVTARDQGVPAVYLNDESGTFKPGYDAKLKSDLINAVLGSGVLHVFTEKDALAILESRGWMPMLEKSREARAKKSA